VLDHVPDHVLDRFHAAAALADAPALLACVTDDIVFLGTDATERWQGEAFRRFLAVRFADGRGWTMRSTQRGLLRQGDVAWFAEDLSHARLGPLRGSGVLTLGADGAWRLALYNLAVTIPNDRFDAARAAMEG